MMNSSNPEERAYFMEVCRYWIREFKVDGWRLDVANEVDRGFWRDFRRVAHEENPESVMIGEIWENSETWLNGDMFDSTTAMMSTASCRTARETCEDFGWQRCSCLPLPEFPAYFMGMNWEWTAVARQHCGGPCLGKRCRMKRMISFPG